MHDLAGHVENVERRADVDARLLEGTASEGAAFPLGFVDEQNVRFRPFLVDPPVEVGC